MSSDSAIDLSGVSKTYRGRVQALRDVSISVGRGEVFGLLGPNGAGKSTLVKIIMTVIRPTRAAGTVLGAELGDRATLSRVGYLPENHRFPKYLSGRQTLEFFGGLCGVPRRMRRRRASEMLEIVGMTDAARRKVSTYSKGMMQRIGLAQALMNDPELLILDEPTDGVDPVGRSDIRQVLAQWRSRGKTVFINSHLLSELELICDRVAMLMNGTVVAQGTMDELSIAEQRYEVEIDGDPAAAQRVGALLPVRWAAAGENGAANSTADGAVMPGLISGILADGTRVQIAGRVIRAMTTDAARVMPLLDALRAGGFVVRRVQAVRPTLEQMFIATVQGRPKQTTDNAAATPAHSAPEAGR
jgi:ABC-2 type transport system ATP-binding protein